MKKIFFTLVLFSVVSHSEANFTFKRSATFSLAYAERVFNSNEGLVEVPITLIDAYSTLFDKATSSFNHHWGARLATALIELPTSSYWLGCGLFVPYHEFGHARASSAFGRPYRYGAFVYGKTIRGIPNFWILSGISLLTPPIFFPLSGGAFVYRTGGESIDNPLLNEHWGTKGKNIIFSAGGINNQSYLAKKIASNIYANGGHITQFFHQVGNKLAGAGYVLSERKGGAKKLGGGDLSYLVRSYQKKSLNIDFRHIEFQSYLSVLSGTTFSFLRGYYNYIANGDPKIYPAEILGVRIPDINSYINARGLSLEMVSGYRWSKNLYFDLAYEFIWKGENAHQATPSIHYNLASIWPKANSLWAHFDLILAKGVGSNLNIEWMPYEQANPTFWQRFSYFADIHLYNGLSLYGERNITSISPTSVLGFSGFLGVRLNY